MGFSSAGFGIDVAADRDPAAVAHHERNLGSKIEVLDLTTSLPRVEREVDVLIAGPPCQGFSTLGSRNPEDPRNALLTVPAEAARTYAPKFFVLENVAGVRSGMHAPRLERSEGALRALGYKVMTIELEMHSFGIPQRRKRVLQLGWRTAGEFRLGQPAGPKVRLSDVLTNLDGVANHDPVVPPAGSRQRRIARHIGPGQKLCNVRSGKSAVQTWKIPEVFGQVTVTEVKVLEALARLRRRDRKRSWGDADPVATRSLSKWVGFPTYGHLRRLQAKGYVRQVGVGVWDLTHTFNGKFRRPSPLGLAPAVDTRFGDIHYVIHPTANRSFTIREAARIQGFPDTFEFVGSIRDQQRMIANAVPPPMAQALAGQIRTFLSAH